MAISEDVRITTKRLHVQRPRSEHVPPRQAETEPITRAAGRALAALRIALGFVFLWAFLDKTFGWSYATPSGKAWINGGSPTRGFLKSVEVGPLTSLFHHIAGTWYANWLFMLGLLGLGVALLLGVAMRIAAVSGALLLAMMWFAEFPPAQHTSGGKLTSSANPLVDYHVIYALAIIAVATIPAAASTWGLGRIWARIPFVRRHSWAR